jgi:hypothetical protein
MITATVEHTTESRVTTVQGKTIEEVIEKIKDFHTMLNLERDLFTQKGGNRLEKEIASGWYLKIPEENRT